MAVTPGGRLWANWYAGKTPGEDQNNYVVLSTSGDGGATWREVLVVDPDGDGPLRTFDPELWMAPDGKLRMFWAQTQGHESTVGGVWCLETAEPESEQPTWEQPVRVTDGVMMCKPLVLTSGEWVLPASTWRKTDHSAKMVVSTDQGKTWTIRGACNVPVAVRAFDEHMFVERKDGSLWLLVRTNYGIGESVSTDRGVTWPELTPSAIAHPSARFFITRLASGNLLLVKHGPIDKRDRPLAPHGLHLHRRRQDLGRRPAARRARRRLLSRRPADRRRPDPHHLRLQPHRRAAHPDGDLPRGGRRRGPGRVRTRCACASSSARLRAALERPSPSRRRSRPTRTASRLRKATPGALAAEDALAQPLAVGEMLFTDRGYVLSELPAALQGARFLRVNLDGKRSCAAAAPARSISSRPSPAATRTARRRPCSTRDSRRSRCRKCVCSTASTANFCTLYQKDCGAGDTIAFGKWAVPVFFP